MLYFTASYFVRFVSGTIISLFILISMKVIVLCLAVLEYKQIYYLKMPYQGVILLLSLYTTTWYTIFNLFTLAIKLRLICKYSYFNPISIIVVFDKKSTLWNLLAFVWQLYKWYRKTCNRLNNPCLCQNHQLIRYYAWGKRLRNDVKQCWKSL